MRELERELESSHGRVGSGSGSVGGEGRARQGNGAATKAEIMGKEACARAKRSLVGCAPMSAWARARHFW